MDKQWLKFKEQFGDIMEDNIVQFDNPFNLHWLEYDMDGQLSYHYKCYYRYNDCDQVIFETPLTFFSWEDEKWVMYPRDSEIHKKLLHTNKTQIEQITAKRYPSW